MVQALHSYPDTSWPHLLLTLQQRTGWSRIEVADYLGVSQQTVMNWQQGKCQPMYRSVLTIQQVLENMGEWGQELLHTYFQPSHRPEPSPADLILTLRHRLGLSQVEFANLLGVTFKTVISWEKGRCQPNPRILAEVERQLRQLGDRGQDLLDTYFASDSQPSTALLLQTLRQRLGLTQAQFAATLGVTLMTISRWEKGRGKPKRRFMPVIKRQVKRLGDRGQDLLDLYFSEHAA